MESVVLIGVVKIVKETNNMAKTKRSTGSKSCRKVKSYKRKGKTVKGYARKK